MDALYAFMRHTDDLADAAPGDCSRRDALAAWRAVLHEALQIANCKLEIANCKLSASNPQSPIPNPSSAILPALADAVGRFHIPREHLDAVIDGVEMDLDSRRYETFDELRAYCERVASAVGLACIHVWGFRGPEAFEPARQAGIALQLTNILRDLKQDAAAGRVYLPLADLREYGYSLDDLLAGVDDQRFRRLMAIEVARAEQFYARWGRALELVGAGRAGAVFGLMMATYHALLRKIASDPAVVFRRQVRLSRVRKLQLLARWSLLPAAASRREGGGRRAEGGGRRAEREVISGPKIRNPRSEIQNCVSALRPPPSAFRSRRHRRRAGGAGRRGRRHRARPPRRAV